jgi:hypothetical protein
MNLDDESAVEYTKKKLETKSKSWRKIFNNAISKMYKRVDFGKGVIKGLSSVKLDGANHKALGKKSDLEKVISK